MGNSKRRKQNISDKPIDGSQPMNARTKAHVIIIKGLCADSGDANTPKRSRQCSLPWRSGYLRVRSVEGEGDRSGVEQTVACSESANYTPREEVVELRRKQQPHRTPIANDQDYVRNVPAFLTVAINVLLAARNREGNECLRIQPAPASSTYCAAIWRQRHSSGLSMRSFRHLALLALSCSLFSPTVARSGFSSEGLCHTPFIQMR